MATYAAFKHVELHKVGYGKNRYAFVVPLDRRDYMFLCKRRRGSISGNMEAFTVFGFVLSFVGFVVVSWYCYLSLSLCRPRLSASARKCVTVDMWVS